MVDVLMLCRELPAAQVQLAVQGALTAGAHDGRAVALLARRSERATPPALQISEHLAGIGSPPPDDLSGYDQLRTISQ
jgi:hypothetical protein